MLVYDVTKKSTFINVQKWLSELRQYAEPDCVIMLVGNKIDLVDNNSQSREVFPEEVKFFTEENKILFYETSAVSNERVNESFEDLLIGIMLIYLEIYNNKLKASSYSVAVPIGYSAYGNNHGSFVKISAVENTETGSTKCCNT